MTDFELVPIGWIRSTLDRLSDAPRQGDEGAPDAWLEIDPAYASALDGINAGDRLLVLTWLHQADRAALQTHPRNDWNAPLLGVFATRSPDRPNPIGLHQVIVRAREALRLRVGPIEAIDGTPIVDLKPVLGRNE
jgi:tRNA-Thr(GGU) m(6)t(6)A37 methyltransferase TsaA